MSAASKAPLLPPTHSQSLCVSASLWRRVVAVYSRAGLSLSAFSSSASPCLWPHPASPPLISLSVRSCAALQRSRAAGDPTPAAGRRGGERRSCSTNAREIIQVHANLLSCTYLHLLMPCSGSGGGGSETVERSAHVTLLTSASRLIEDTWAGRGGLGAVYSIHSVRLCSITVDKISDGWREASQPWWWWMVFDNHTLSNKAGCGAIQAFMCASFN